MYDAQQQYKIHYARNTMDHQRFYACISLHLQLRCDRFNKLHFKLHDLEHLSEIDEV